MSLFNRSNYYQLSDFQVYFQNDKAYAKATTKIDILFMSGTPFTFKDEVEAPIID